MRRSATVLAATTRALIDRAAEEGLDPGELLRAANLEEERLHDPHARVDAKADTAVWSAIERQLGDGFGLRFAEDLEPSAFGAVGFLAMASADVRTALQRATDHHAVIKDDAETRLTEIESGWFVEELLPPGHPRWAPPIVDYALATYLVLLRKWTGVHVRPQLVAVPYTRPRDLSWHERVFGSPVLFDQPTIGFVLDRETLDLPLRTAQPAYEGFLAQLAASARAAVERPDVEREVRDAIAARLASGAELDTVARALGTSARTLQRRLAQRGLAFQRLVDDVRHATALPLLSTTSLSIEEISERLGYAEAAAFRRAFRRWTGVAPGELRSANRRSA